MQLLYDDRDLAAHRSRGSHIIEWLNQLGGKPLSTAALDEPGYLFAGARPIDDYRQLVGKHPNLRDQPDDRRPLLRLDDVLDAMTAAGVAVPMPRTWRLPLDAPLPGDLKFPLFVRTAFSSWKLGGRISRVRNRSQLESESAELRRALGWDSLILAREWLDLAESGRGVYGPVPVEVRTWIVDGVPHAWSFHHMNVMPKPAGFPLPPAGVQKLRDLAARVGTAFGSRLVVADFAKTVRGDWVFIEAGPGSCAGTADEAVFKSVAMRLRGVACRAANDDLGGTFE